MQTSLMRRHMVWRVGSSSSLTWRRLRGRHLSTNACGVTTAKLYFLSVWHACRGAAYQRRFWRPQPAASDANLTKIRKVPTI